MARRVPQKRPDRVVHEGGNTMPYRVAVEDLEPNHFIAYALDMPACFSSARVEAEAIALAPVRITEHLDWLTRHEGRTETKTPIEVQVVETFQSFPSAEDPEYIVNAFFEDDRRPLTSDEVKTILQLLEWTRDDLLKLIHSLTLEQLQKPVVGETHGSIAGVLSHVAGAENWYFSHLGLGMERDTLPSDPVERYETVRAHTRAQLPKLIGDERITTNYDEQWSARKVVRRTLWHERDHTEHIAQLIGRL